jgi:hypothetical protein
MSSAKKQNVTVALDEPDLALVKQLADRERSSTSTIVRRFVAEGLQAMQAPAAERAA